MIRVDQVSLAVQGKAILQGISFALEKRSSLGIIGPNGAGKSTLLHVMGGHLSPDKGRVLLNDADIKTYKAKELARKLAFMQQISQVESRFTAYETVMLARYPYLRWFQTESDRDHQICLQSMERTCTVHVKERQMDEVSGGERQRVLLAQVLAQEPELLLLDEPTTYLDLFHQMELLNMLKQEQGKGLTWAAVLHDLNLAAQYCDYLLLLQEGRVAFFGTPHELFRTNRLEEVFDVGVRVVEVPGLSVPQIIVTPKCIPSTPH